MNHILTASAPFVIVRSDRVAEQWYKKFTIREVTAAPAGPGEARRRHERLR